MSKPFLYTPDYNCGLVSDVFVTMTFCTIFR